ncbi:MAG: hypothetical protein QOF30_1604 [Acidimicrobiaceae bacterium]|nr:hypothetical protein [Acidimicrobiaceae bacterium]
MVGRPWKRSHAEPSISAATGTASGSCGRFRWIVLAAPAFPVKQLATRRQRRDGGPSGIPGGPTALVEVVGPFDSVHPDQTPTDLSRSYPSLCASSACRRWLATAFQIGKSGRASRRLSSQTISSSLAPGPVMAKPCIVDQPRHSGCGIGRLGILIVRGRAVRSPRHRSGRPRIPTWHGRFRPFPPTWGGWGA